MKKQLTKTKLKKLLDAYTREELTELVCTLYSGSTEASQIIDRTFLGDDYSRQLYEENLKKLNKLISFPGFSRGSMKKAERLLKEFASAGSPADVMRLYVDYIELCVELDNDFGMDWETLYNSVYRAFDKLAQLALHADPKVIASLQRRLDLIVEQSSDGYAFRENLQDMMLNSVFSEEPEER